MECMGACRVAVGEIWDRSSICYSIEVTRSKYQLASHGKDVVVSGRGSGPESDLLADRDCSMDL